METLLGTRRGLECCTVLACTARDQQLWPIILDLYFLRYLCTFIIAHYVGSLKFPYLIMINNFYYCLLHSKCTHSHPFTHLKPGLENLVVGTTNMLELGFLCILAPILLFVWQSLTFAFPHIYSFTILF